LSERKISVNTSPGKARKGIAAPGRLAARPFMGLRLGVAGAILVVIAGSLATASSSAATTSTLLKRGDLRSDRWAVAATAVRERAVCVGTVIGGWGNVQSRTSEVCGDVKPSRLVITSQVAPQRQHPRSSITVAGGVFARSVIAVEFLTDGRSTRIRRPLDPVSVGGRRYRYMAFAVPGRWCPDTIVTRGRSGRELAHARWSIVSGEPCG
jgi:hypothetical protein